VRVLVVEDEQPLAAALKRGLEAEGFSVELSHSGTDGAFLATEHRYDLLVLDIMLPGMNGYDVCRAIRAAGVGTPILMLTAKDGEYDEADAFDLGADDYLSKPFSYVVLVARLRALLRRAHGESAPVLTAGDLQLDPATRRCQRGGVDIELTPREFAVLEFLVRHRGEVVGKTELLHHVWDVNFEGDVNVVEVYVGYLRRKIDVPFDRRTLQTVRGVGYRLTA